MRTNNQVRDLVTVVYVSVAVVMIGVLVAAVDNDSLIEMPLIRSDDTNSTRQL